jgi:hypothetical protein
VTAKIIPTSLHNSYVLQSYCTHHFQNPNIFSSKLALRIIQGLNLPYVIFMLWSKMRLGISLQLELPPNSVGLILGGRMNPHIQTRFVPKMNALSLSSLTHTILDIGIISSGTSLGLLGVQVGTIL